MKHTFLIALAVAALSGCAAHVPPGTEPFPDEPTARVRFFGNNGYDMSFYRNTACIPKNEDGATKVSGGMGHSLGAQIGADQTKSIGMPESRRSAAKRDANNGTEFFSEFRVAAGKPLSFTGTFQQWDRWAPFGMPNFWSASCATAGSTFVPQAGKDYDVYLDQQTRNTCLATAMEIVDLTKSVRAKVEPAKTCS